MPDATIQLAIQRAGDQGPFCDELGDSLSFRHAHRISVEIEHSRLYFILCCLTLFVRSILRQTQSAEMETALMIDGKRKTRKKSSVVFGPLPFGLVVFVLGFIGLNLFNFPCA